MNLPSPLPSLRGLIERTVTVSDLVTASLWSIDPADTAEDAASVLSARDFDVAGIAEEPISRYVTRDILASATGTVDEVALQILATDTVERSLPLIEFAEILLHKPYVFILDQDRVRWVATRADLQAPAVTVVVLSYLVAIEVGLASLVPIDLGDNWFSRLSEASRASALKIYEQKRARNVAIGLEDCLYFKDWIHLVQSSPSLVVELGYRSKRAFHADTGSFPELRNDLAHGGSLLNSATPEEAIERFKRIRDLADRVWDTLEEKDEQWDVFASTIFTLDSGMPLTEAIASDPLRLQLPLHIVTAWNPGSITRSREVNEAANSQLLQLIKNNNRDPISVDGRSPDGDWNEESFVISGMSRLEAADLGERFGQRSIFELSKDGLSVVRCADSKVMRTAEL